MLCWFVTYLFMASLSHQTIIAYLCAVRNLHITNGLPDPSLASFACLNYVLKGLHWEPKPATKWITYWLHQSCSSAFVGHGHRSLTQLWQNYAMGDSFFCFMRAGEFTCPSYEAFPPAMLTTRYVSIDWHVLPTQLAVHLMPRKTNQFGTGTTKHLSNTGSILCPVTVMLSHLAIPPPAAGPLFVNSDGSIFSRPLLVLSLCQALKPAGDDDS